MDYHHSETFAKLKGIKEQIAENLTSYEYLNSLDTLIYNSLFPIVDSTKYADIFLAKVLAWQATNPKRKASGIGRQALTSYITLFFLMNSTEKKLDTLRKAKLDRGILVEIVRRWLAITVEYEQLVNKIKLTKEEWVRLSYLEKLTCLKPSYSLYGVMTQVKYWYELTTDFKMMILEKYTRLCLNKAQQDYVQLNHRVELEDIIQVYLMTASKAIDKCDTEKGVLTNHIQNWLMSAKNTVTASYITGVAFQTPNQSKTQINKLGTTVPLSEIDDLAIDESEYEEKEERITRVRRLSRIFDPVGYARLMLGIREVLTKKERELLHSYSS
jgi:hypothetical protein